ncbi:hypothetical protein LVQ79_02145 [Buttiauxella sp. A2-C1_F]|uniref:hypothetical protein n=1 Tax=Buttiauxella sp. A2-C1_F TaxID=2904526 RepID=UPI001E2AA0F4|nr:hypothetical protein [Buttiauxella sp. A2-C1_F]MCE0844361.1 hypothetical protein [Buttiauxella sp. A2-C1_F]
MNIIPRIPRSVCLKDGENEKEDPPASFSPHLFHSQHAGDFIVDSYKRKIRNNRYHENYIHDVLYPGAVFQTKKDGECTVLGRSEDKSRRGYYIIQFNNSNIIKEAYGAHIKSGSVSDETFPATEEERQQLLMKPRYFDVGYIGNGKHSTIQNAATNQRTRSFILWHNMLARCYMTCKGKPYFKGYKGVIVCERWHNFQNFCNDLPALHGYNKWKNNPGEYELDKDFSHRRIYSPDTVAFISVTENAKEAGLRRAAMKITREQYHSINRRREEILFDAEEELNKNKVAYEIILSGNMKIIISETPYGTVAFWPLTCRIQRNSYMTEGDASVYVRYLNWLKQQWESRNYCINCIAVS